ncbi:MAG: hypothetical protein LBE91_14995, partial [Tannerella sp.]|jgi:hypothetical protein|nr:hypothetical protein [Tannerella sp.]
MNDELEILRPLLSRLGINNLCGGTREGDTTYYSNVNVNKVQTASNEFFYDISHFTVCVQDEAYPISDNVLPIVIYDRQKEEENVVKIVKEYYDKKIKEAEKEEKSKDKPDLTFVLPMLRDDLIKKITNKNVKVTVDDFPGELVDNEEKIRNFINAYGGPRPKDDRTWLNEYKPSELRQWAESENLFASFSYQFVNDWYAIVQVFTDGYVNLLFSDGRSKDAFNEWTGGNARYNIDGSTNYTPYENLANIIPTLFSGGISKVSTSIFGKSKVGLNVLTENLPKRAGFINKFTNKSQMTKITMPIIKAYPNLKNFLYQNSTKQSMKNILNRGIDFWNKNLSKGTLFITVEKTLIKIGKGEKKDKE